MQIELFVVYGLAFDTKCLQWVYMIAKVLCRLPTIKTPKKQQHQKKSSKKLYHYSIWHTQLFSLLNDFRIVTLAHSTPQWTDPSKMAVKWGWFHIAPN